MVPGAGGCALTSLCEPIIAEVPTPEPDSARVDNKDAQRKHDLQQLTRQRIPERGKRLAGFTSEGYRVGETRKDCKISDQMVRWLRDQHEIHGRGWRRLAKETGLPPRTVMKILDYSRRASVAATWKREPYTGNDDTGNV